jgi:predicted RNA-binding Zn ribbon-like protein
MTSFPPAGKNLGETRDGFRFRGGHPALDLVATLAARLKPEPRELLGSPRDLDRWLAAAGFAQTRSGASPQDLEDARRLREAIYQVAVARINGGAWPARSLSTINAIAANPPATPRLARDGSFSLAGDARATLATLAHEAIRLFGGEQGERVRQCAGDGCALLFLDTSRSSDRRWCSMTACGNRAKVAEFRRRKKRGAGAS